MGDKIAGTKVDSNTGKENTSLGTNFGKLKGKTKEQLVEDLFSIKDKENVTSAWLGSEALKSWCLKALDIPFEEGLTYDNAKDYCVISPS